MPSKPLTVAAALKQLKSVDTKLDKATGEQRLALLRQQAHLGDQRDAAADARAHARAEASR